MRLMGFFKKTKKCILLPIVEDFPTMKMAFKFAALFLKEDPTLVVKHFFPLTGEDMLGEQNRLYRRARTFRYYGYFYEKKVRKTHSISLKDIAFSNFSLFFWNNTNRKINSKEELLRLKFKDVLIGDLIYDTYLRYKNKPTVDIHDPALQDLINYAYQLASKIDNYVTSGKVGVVIIPFTTYIHWGILTRIALSYDIPVFTYGNLYYILQKASKEYPFHSKDYSKFREIFQALPDKEDFLKSSGIMLEKRLSGVIDESIKYMRKSAFASDADSPKFIHEGEKPFAIIFAHCFFDSPHIYGNSLFPDFFEWMKFLLCIAIKQRDVTYYVKPHPNGIKGNDEIIAELLNEFNSPNIILLNSEISNNELIKSKPNAIFSVYGTVCHEFAYSNIPAVLAGENPHGKYSFYYNAGSKPEMEKFIKEVGKYGLPQTYNKHDIEEFFFMNYMYLARNIYNMEMEKVKDFESGEMNIPEKSSFTDLLYS